MKPMRCNANRIPDSYVFIITGFTLLALLMLMPAAVAGVDCSDVNGSPVVDFTYATVPAETVPIMVNFYSTSDGGRTSKGTLTDPVESYLWKFGDGDTSEEANPMHTYFMSSARQQAAHKPFGVTLTVKTECGRSNTTTKNVSVYCLDQTAGFTIVQPVEEGPYTAPVALYIKDTSLHTDDVTRYHYTIWDSGMTRLFKESTEKDPTFIIRNGGSYVIRQEVFKTCNNPPTQNTEMKKNIEVTGSASSDAVPMETIPFTTTVTETSATATLAAAPSTTVSTSTTTAPAQIPVEASPGTGTLSVTTSPAGAQVFVNDALLGLSPATITGLSVGSYNLRLEKSGYRKKTVPIIIGDRMITDYSTTLEAESGGMGIVPIIAAVLVIAAGAGAVYWYRKKKRPKIVDWNNP
ncbi:MAG: PEGA domain-containing protein [Methanoregula sp.]|jgi:PKD repeat protein